MTARWHARAAAIRRIAAGACARATIDRFRRLLGARVFRPLVVAAALVGPVAAAGAADVSIPQLRAMARTGAPALALSLLNRAQPSVDADPEAWANWERVRITILAESRAWERALDRLRDPPAAASARFHRWARERRAVFHLELGQATAASELLRGLLWRDGHAASTEQFERWRRLVIRAHLVAGRVVDAVTALRRFEQDFGAGADAWAALRTRVLLRAGHPGEAAADLPEGADGELAVLALLARARAGQLDAAEAYDRCVEAATAEGVAAADAARWWFAAAEIAGGRDDLGRRALATERALTRAGALPAGDRLFALDGDDLWDAWLAFGRRVGNADQLLIGDDEAWFAAAEQAMPNAPVRSRALLAVVAQHGGDEARAQAHRRLLDHLDRHGPGLAVARQAYLASGRYPDLASVPAGVRYRLVDDALARDDLTLASRLLAGLSAPPPGVEPFAWNLMRARVLVRGERHAEGAGVLARVINAHPGLKGDRLDRLLQVVFDLQGAGEHQRALALLERLMHDGLPAQRRRELWYWQAESYDGLDQHREAAAHYLRSALLTTDPDHIPGADPWGQTARYQAAGMLAEAGLVGDARRIYEDLLRITGNADRRATLRHRLRQLPSNGMASDDLPADRREGS